jgi:hypothetical protein
MEALNSFVAISSIYLPDAVCALKCATEAQTLEVARDRILEATTVITCLLKLSQEAALELKAMHRPISHTQEAEAVLKCLLQTSGPSPSRLESVRSAG